MTDATLPAAVPLRLPPRSAYATPSSKSSKSTQRLKSSLTYYPIRPFTPLHVCMKDLTADIFHGLVSRNAGPKATLPTGGPSSYLQPKEPIHADPTSLTAHRPLRLEVLPSEDH